MQMARRVVVKFAGRSPTPQVDGIQVGSLSYHNEISYDLGVFQYLEKFFS